jgi:hypothetical protein
MRRDGPVLRGGPWWTVGWTLRSISKHQILLVDSNGGPWWTQIWKKSLWQSRLIADQWQDISGTT